MKVNTRIYINIRYFPHLTALTIGNYYPLIFANEFINFLTRITLQKIILADVNSFKIGKSFGTLIKMDAYFTLMHILTKKMGGLVCFQALNLLERELRLKNIAIVHSSQSSPKSIDALLLQDKIYDELISSRKRVYF